jgi:hypothetical protein
MTISGEDLETRSPEELLERLEGKVVQMLDSKELSWENAPWSHQIRHFDQQSSPGCQERLDRLKERSGILEMLQDVKHRDNLERTFEFSALNVFADDSESPFALGEVSIEAVHLHAEHIRACIAPYRKEVTQSAADLEHALRVEGDTGTSEEIERLACLLTTRLQKPPCETAIVTEVLGINSIAVEGIEANAIQSRIRVDEPAPPARDVVHALAPSGVSTQHGRIICTAKVAGNMDISRHGM